MSFHDKRQGIGSSPGNGHNGDDGEEDGEYASKSRLGDEIPIPRRRRRYDRPINRIEKIMGAVPFSSLFNQTAARIFFQKIKSRRADRDDDENQHQRELKGLQGG